MSSVQGRLTSVSVVLGGLPELPGRNGAVLLIDDEERARCVADIDAGAAEIERLLSALKIAEEAMSAMLKEHPADLSDVVALETVQSAIASGAA